MSTIRSSPYINFQGRAREAMEFYQKALGGHVDLWAVDAQGASKPAGPGDRVMHARLEADGALLTGSDGHPDHPPTVGDNMGVDLGGTDKARLTKIFNDLAQGGMVKMPLTAQPGGIEVGWVADRFGITWSVHIDMP